MKKLLVLFVSLFLLAIPCFAGELQFKWEYKFYNTYMKDYETEVMSINPDDLVTGDYKGYLNGKKSFYGMILYMKEQYEELPDTNLNKKYSNMIFNNYHLRLKAVNTNTYLVGVIDIPDNEYQKLDERVKQALASYNYLIAQDK